MFYELLFDNDITKQVIVIKAIHLNFHPFCIIVYLTHNNDIHSMIKFILDVSLSFLGKSQRKGGFFVYLENTDGLPVIHDSGGGGGGGQGPYILGKSFV